MDDYRKKGLIALLVSAFLCYCCVYGPLDQANNHAEKISVWLFPSIFCPVGIVAGTAYLILGNRAAEILGTRQQPKKIWLAVCVLLVVLGAVLYAWLRRTLEAKGYHFK